jgi:hypothetical protein
MASLADFTKPYDWKDEYGPLWLQRETMCMCAEQRPVRTVANGLSLLRCEGCNGLITKERRSQAQ